MKAITKTGTTPIPLPKPTVEAEKKTKYLETKDLLRISTTELIALVEAKHYLSDDIKDMVNLRMRNTNKASETILKQEYQKEFRPQWFKVMIVEELERRNAFKKHKTASETSNQATKTYKVVKDLERMKCTELIDWVETSDYLVQDAKDVLLQRFGRVSIVKDDTLQRELATPQRPDWYKELINLEVSRRKGIKARNNAKQEKRAAYKAQQNRTSLLASSKEHSIFKIKFQYANGIHYITTQYSRDYIVERQALAKLSEQELRLKLDDKGEFAYELFDEGGIREKAFNGFKYSLQQFEKLKAQGKICFFGIFLNNTKETHTNGEEYARTIYRWGEWKEQKLDW